MECDNHKMNQAGVCMKCGFDPRTEFNGPASPHKETAVEATTDSDAYYGEEDMTTEDMDLSFLDEDDGSELPGEVVRVSEKEVESPDPQADTGQQS